MRITILGSGGGLGIPNPFCRCDNCEAARRTGGKSLRNAPAVLVNYDLLIDCGSDVINSVRQLGLSLHSLTTLIITHRHSDHVDPWFFWARRGVAGDRDLPLLTVYAPEDVRDYVVGFYHNLFGWDRAALEAQTRTVWRAVRPGMMKLAGRYRIHFFPAAHHAAEGEPTMTALLVGVRDVRAAYLHGYDSGPYSEETWAMLAHHHFDVALIDACIHTQPDYQSDNHMTAEQTVATAQRLREKGILTPDGAAIATHFVHQAAGLHDDLVAFYEPQGLQVAYDGLTLDYNGAE